MAAGTPLKYEQAIQVCSLPRKDFSMQIPTSLSASDHTLFWDRIVGDGAEPDSGDLSSFSSAGSSTSHNHWVRRM